MNDAKNIALVSSAAEAAQAVMRLLLLDEISAAARIGFAFAISQRMDPTEPVSGPRENNFSVGTIDRNGEFPTLLEVFYADKIEEDTSPYRMVEVLMNRGLIELGERISKGQIQDVEDILEATEVTTDVAFEG